MQSQILTGDCVEVMAGMDAASVDAIVTDPPYGLEFMGKEWDRLGAVALHDPSVVGGFQDGNGGNPFSRSRIRYGSDVRSAQGWHQQWATEAFRVARPGAYLLAFGGTRTYHRMTCAIEDAGWIIRDCLVWAYASGFPKSRALLKPAWEPIVMARKPGPLRELAIDACRIGTTREVPASHSHTTGSVKVTTNRLPTELDPNLGRWPANLILTDPIFDGDTPGVVGGGETSSGKMMPTEVRNGERTVFGSDAVAGYTTIETYGDTGTYSRFFLIPKADRAEREPVLGGHGLPQAIIDIAGLNAPEQRAARGVTSEYKLRANVHPTVKPLDLMRHLVRLVTPQGGLVLDPFLGSGTTALAAEMEGFRWLGIEKEPEYVAIAEARLNGTQRGLGLEVS